MNTIEIAKKLAELCKQGRNMEALDILFADDVVKCGSRCNALCTTGNKGPRGC